MDIFLKNKQKEEDPTGFGKKTGNDFNENDQIWYNAFYSSSQGKKRSGRYLAY